MKQIMQKLSSEEGSVLFFTLLILVMMAAAGFTMISNSVLESNIVRNASSRTINFYAAESAAMEAAQRIEDENDVVKLSTHNEDWLNPNGPSDPKLADPAVTWDYDNLGGDDTAEAGSTPNTAFSAVRVGIAKSASLGMENPDLLYEYSVLGRYYDSNGNSMAMIEAGFLKRY